MFRSYLYIFAIIQLLLISCNQKNSDKNIIRKKQFIRVYGKAANFTDFNCFHNKKQSKFIKHLDNLFGGFFPYIKCCNYFANQKKKSYEKNIDIGNNQIIIISDFKKKLYEDFENQQKKLEEIKSINRYYDEEINYLLLMIKYQKNMYLEYFIKLKQFLNNPNIIKSRDSFTKLFCEFMSLDILYKNLFVYIFELERRIKNDEQNVKKYIIQNINYKPFVEQLIRFIKKDIFKHKKSNLKDNNMIAEALYENYIRSIRGNKNYLIQFYYSLLDFYFESIGINQNNKGENAIKNKYKEEFISIFKK